MSAERFRMAVIGLLIVIAGAIWFQPTTVEVVTPPVWSSTAPTQVEVTVPRDCEAETSSALGRYYCRRGE